MVFRVLACLFALAGTAGAQEFVVTFGGDVNFARSRTSPEPARVSKFGYHRIETLTAELSRDWDGHLNFINVETVVSEKRLSGALGKAFVFRSHPDNFRHLMSLGVNAFALANNHTYDYGRQGMDETLAFFGEAARAGAVYAGVGDAERALSPMVRDVAGFKVALSALSFGPSSYEAGPDRTGFARVSNPSHVDEVLKRLGAADADLRILSIHTGTENVISLNSGQRALFRRAVEEANVDLVLGHHPHVVRPVEIDRNRGAAIYYSLGNLLFIGGAEKDSQPVGRDYGMLGKAYFYRMDGEIRLTAIEAVPYKGVHLKPRRLDGNAFSSRIRHLNRLSAGELGSASAEFSVIENDGRSLGMQCLGAPYGPKAEAHCCGIDESALCELPDLM